MENQTSTEYDMYRLNIPTIRIEILSFDKRTERTVWKFHSISNSVNDAKKMMNETNSYMRAYMCLPNERIPLIKNFDKIDEDSVGGIYGS